MTGTGGSTTDSRYSGDRFTVLVVPSGPLGSAVVDVLETWARAGMLVDHAIVDSGKPGGEYEIPCLTNTESGTEPHDLFRVLQRCERRLVRVVDLQVISDAADDWQEQARVAERVRARTMVAMPPLVAGKNDEFLGTEVDTINLIASVSGLAGQTADRLKPTWSHNVIVSPEDREDPLRANVFVRHTGGSGNLAQVAANATVVAGGLLRDIETGPFDAGAADASFGDHVTVMRATTRALLGEPVLERVAEEAMRAVKSEPSAITHSPERFAPADTPAEVVAAMHRHLLDFDGRALSAPEVPPGRDLPTAYVDIRQGWREYVNFSGSALAAWCLWVVGKVVRRYEKTATRALVGAKSGIELRHSVTPDLAAQLQLTYTRDHEGRLPLVDAICDEPIVPVSREVWMELRRVAFGVLDGGDLPDAVRLTTVGRRQPLLPDVALITPDPSESFTVSPQVRSAAGVDAPGTIRSCDPAAAAAVAERLSQRISELSEGEDPGHRQTPPENAQAPRGEPSAAEADDQRALLEAERQRLDGWVAGRRGSFAWQLAESVSRAAAQKREQAAALEADLRLTPSLSTDVANRPFRRFCTTVSSWLLVTGALLVLAALMRERIVLLWGPRWFWTGVVAASLACLVALTFSINRYYKAVLELIKNLQETLNLRQRQLVKFQAVCGAARRLEGANLQVRDWLEIVAISLYDPWCDPESARAASAAWPSESAPTSLIVGEPYLSGNGDHEKAVRTGAAGITSLGWRTRAFNRLVRHHARADESDAALLRRIDDDGLGSLGPRSDFLKALKDRRPQVGATKDVLGDATERLREDRFGVEEPQVQRLAGGTGHRQVVSLSEFTRGLDVPATPLDLDVFNDSALADGAHSRLTTMIWAPTRWAPIPSSGHPQTVDESVHRRAGLTQCAARVDLTAPLEWSALKLFTPVSASAERLPAAASGEFL